MSPIKQFEIPCPSLFSFEECLWYLNRNFDDCLYSIKEAEVVKAININGKTLLVSVKENGQSLLVEILNGDVDKADSYPLSAYIHEWFDLEREISPFYDLLHLYPTLSHLAKDYRGLRIMGISDLFEALCWSIIGQQINLTFAYKLKRRLVEQYGTELIFGEEKYYLFPDYEIIARAQIEDLRAMQFSQKKAEYIIGMAKRFALGELSKEMLYNLPDLESQQKALTNIKGIGIWTANYVLMKTLKAASAIPHGDVGLLKALENYKIIAARNEVDKITALFEKFKGWESYLVFYLWRTLSKKQ